MEERTFKRMVASFPKGQMLQVPQCLIKNRAVKAHKWVEV
jgi:hypothetical protein